MDKLHFELTFRYKAILKDGRSINIDLKPETCYYFYEQEETYIIRAIRHQDNINIEDVERIEKYFIPVESEDVVDCTIGL